MSINENNIPVLVGCGQFTDRNTDGSGLRPIEMMVAACKAAAADTENKRILDLVDHLAATGLTVDAPQAKTPISGGFKNVPQSVANSLGIKPKRTYYAATGGNTPQYLVNRFAGQIAQGEADTVLLVGGESLATMLAKFDQMYKWLLPKGDWRDDPGSDPEYLGDTRASNNSYEGRHGLDLPANVYPLFENALQAHYGHSTDAHRALIGKMFSQLTEVAENNPFAWFQQRRSAKELIEPSARNRMVAFPYTKRLVSMIGVNQSAALLLTNVARAKQLKIPRSRWVYLHGSADANDIWHVSERDDFISSPAMRWCAEHALKMADKSIDQINHFDIYSCFPSAVQIACDELEIKHDDPRGLSLTGGLPYFGGPGNNYTMHAIAEMMRRLRGSPGDFGLLNANGWFLTKHSVGIYSTEEPNKPDSRQSLSSYPQKAIGKRSVEVIEKPEGRGTIETFTVLYDRQQRPVKGIIVGRDDQGRRFLANTPKDKELMTSLTEDGTIGRAGKVSSKRSKNTFIPD